MTHEQRQACFYAAQGLRALLSAWNGTSHDDKIGAIKDALAAFAYVPLPDDLQDEETVEELGERIDALSKGRIGPE